MQKKLGLLGGGQLGLMLIEPAKRLDIDLHFLDPNPNCSVSNKTDNLTVGDFTDYETVLAFGQTVDVISIEIEHVNVDALEALEAQGKPVHPSSTVLRTIQDKGLQKQFYADNDIPSPVFRLINDKSEITDFPIVQKARTGGYDGKGVQLLRTEVDLAKAFEAPSVLESLVDIDLEVGVIVTRNEAGDVSVFPPVDMEFCPDLNLVKYVISPSVIDNSLNKKCVQLSASIIESLDMVGLLAVELFITKTGEVLVNECAPRVHNSGHLTIEGTTTSQFEMHLRAVMGMALPSVKITKPSVMVNLVGEGTGTPQIKNEDVLTNMEKAYLHWYEKTEVRPGRKMGHMTVLADTREEARKQAEILADNLSVVSVD